MSQAISIYNNSIYLLGGSQNAYQFVEYIVNMDPTSNAMIDHGSNFLPIISRSTRQFFSNYNSDIYNFVDAENTMYIFNFITKSYTVYLTNVDVPNFLGGCLQATDEYFFIVGGGWSSGPYLDSLQRLSLQNHNWSLLPTMNIKRGRLTCQIHPENGMLYAIGGSSDSTYYEKSIEAIHAVQAQSWQYIAGQLIQGLYGTFSMVHKSSILVIAGYSGSYLDTIQVIDINTGLVTSGGTLNYGIQTPSCIIFNNVIYVFGGNQASGPVNTFQYHVLPEEPTSVPTTINPTTSNPTTNNPTTLNPTIYNPTTFTPTTSIPTTSIPTTNSPSTTQPTTYIPTPVSPSSMSPVPIPTTMSPTTAEPTANNPTSNNPITSTPTTNSPSTIQPATSIPTNMNPTMSPTQSIPTTSVSTTAVPTTNFPTFSPTKCESNDNLENDDCTDIGCDADKPYLDFSLSFNVCKKQPFNGNRYGLWDAMANCLCEL
eukprot:32884_1